MPSHLSCPCQFEGSTFKDTPSKFCHFITFCPIFKIKAAIEWGGGLLSRHKKRSAFSKLFDFYDTGTNNMF